MRVAGYARVSAKDKGQDTEHQLHTLAAQYGSMPQLYTNQEPGGEAAASDSL